MKEVVGRELAARVKDGDVLGVGTGSTVDAALVALGERIKHEGLLVKAVPTSYQSAWRLEEIGVIALSPEYSGTLSWGFDGADAIDKNRVAIKGKGGALLEEKILAAKCRHYVIIVDDSKVCSDVCSHCEIPVEVVPSAINVAKEGLLKIGAVDIKLRNAVSTKHGPVITERGNIILDAKFSSFRKGLEREIKSVIGVVESGLFESYANEVLVATKSGKIERW